METDVTIITHFVKTGRNNQYEKWLHYIYSALINFEGYQGITVLRPVDNSNDPYQLIIRFNDATNRAQWESSWVRKKLLTLLDPIVQQDTLIAHTRATDFTSDEQHVEHKPKEVSAWKMALLAWCCAFPIILILNTVMTVLAPSLPFLLRTMIMSMLLISTLSIVIMPRVGKLFAAWQHPLMVPEQSKKIGKIFSSAPTMFSSNWKAQVLYPMEEIVAK